MSPFLPCPLTAPFIFISFYCLVCLLTVHHTLTTLLFLWGLCCQTWTPFQLTPPSSFCFLLSPAVALSVFLPSEDLQCWSSICTWEGDWQWREQGELWRENSRREEQNRVSLHKDRAICQPKGVGFETNRAVIRSKLAQKWVLCDWCTFFPLGRLIGSFFLFPIHSGALQRNREVVREGKRRFFSGKIWRQGKQAGYMNVWIKQGQIVLYMCFFRPTFTITYSRLQMRWRVTMHWRVVWTVTKTRWTRWMTAGRRTRMDSKQSSCLISLMEVSQVRMKLPQRTSTDHRLDNWGVAVETASKKICHKIDYYVYRRWLLTAVCHDQQEFAS